MRPNTTRGGLPLCPADFLARSSLGKCCAHGMRRRDPIITNQCRLGCRCLRHRSRELLESLCPIYSAQAPGDGNSPQLSDRSNAYGRHYPRRPRGFRRQTPHRGTWPTLAHRWTASVRLLAKGGARFDRRLDAHSECWALRGGLARGLLWTRRNLARCTPPAGWSSIRVHVRPTPSFAKSNG